MPAKPTKKSKTKKTPRPPSSGKPAASFKRIRKIAKHRTFKLTKKQTIATKPLPTIKKLIGDTFSLILNNKKIFFGITIIFALLQFIFTKGLGSAFDIVQTKQELQDYLGDEGQSLDTSYALFNYLLGSFNGQINGAAGTYQLFFTVAVILAVIWLSRQILAGEKPQIRDGFYKGMYPVIPFVLVLVVISLQMLPALIGNFVFSTVLENGLAVTFLEKFIWFLLFAILLLFSLYMLLSSVFALNIVTLPDVRPLKSLRSARELVLHRRAGIFARILVLPILGFLLSVLVFVPLIMFATVLVEPIFLLFSSFGIVLMTVYMYNFYRALL